MPVARRYAIAGRIDVPAYCAFVAGRARWLDLSGWIGADGAGRVAMVAARPEALVGALEMAAALGPLSALVDTIESSDEDGPVAPGFVVR